MRFNNFFSDVDIYVINYINNFFYSDGLSKLNADAPRLWNVHILHMQMHHRDFIDAQKN